MENWISWYQPQILLEFLCHNSHEAVFESVIKILLNKSTVSRRVDHDNILNIMYTRLVFDFF